MEKEDSYTHQQRPSSKDKDKIEVLAQEKGLIGNLQSFNTNPYQFLELSSGTNKSQNWLWSFFSRSSEKQEKANVLPYEQMIAKFEQTKLKGETMFILPEYYKFKHIFRKIDPRFIDNLHEENITQCSAYLYRAYIQCMRRLENLVGPNKD